MQWLMLLSLLVILLGSLVTVHRIVNGIDDNTRHNDVVLSLSKQIEGEAQLVSGHMLPAFRALHSLEILVSRHVAEFELYVLDADRDRKLLMQSLERLELALENMPRSFHKATGIQRDELEETVGVFIDIALEALEVRSPNKLFQLLADSEDVLNDFTHQVEGTRAAFDREVSRLGLGVSKNLHVAGESLAEQRVLLSRLEKTSILALTILVLFVGMVTFILYRSLRRRLGSVAEYAHAVADGDYHSSIDFQSSDQIGEMAESVNQMGQRLASLVEEAEGKAHKAALAEQAALRLANYDPLTGLPNRKHFLEILDSGIAQARVSGQRLAVVYLDLDDFKKVNDSYGHVAGDQLLCAVAERLKHSLRASDPVSRDGDNLAELKLSRLGGDEFTFLIHGIHSVDEAKRVAGRVLESLVQPHRLFSREFSVTSSLGVAVFPDHADSVEELLKNADMAMYQAKEYGRNNVMLYCEELGRGQLDRLSLERDLSKAIRRGELHLRYQPKIDLRTSRVVGAEALLRWKHPVRGLVSPGHFIPIAEESTLIIEIGEWVLGEVCRQMNQWSSDYGACLVPVSVNISAKQFARGDLISMVEDQLNQARFATGLIELELTESVLMSDIEMAIETLRELKALGVKVSLDDFGTGYSSLNYLKRLHLNTLKIDQSFVKDIETDEDDAAIVKAIISLADSMGLEVVAEGVETEQQAGFLNSHGCGIAQGFLFHRPLPPEVFHDLVTRNPSEAAPLAGLPASR